MSSRNYHGLYIIYGICRLYSSAVTYYNIILSLYNYIPSVTLQLIYDYYKVVTDYYYMLRIGTDIFFIASHAHVRGVTRLSR